MIDVTGEAKQRSAQRNNQQGERHYRDRQSHVWDLGDWRCDGEYFDGRWACQPDAGLKVDSDKLVVDTSETCKPKAR